MKNFVFLINLEESCILFINQGASLQYLLEANNSISFSWRSNHSRLSHNTDYLNLVQYMKTVKKKVVFIDQARFLNNIIAIDLYWAGDC